MKIVRKRFHEKPDIRVGQKGIHDSLIASIRRLMKKTGGIVKIKILRNIASSKLEVQKIVNEIASRIGANFIKIIGRSAVIVRIDKD